MFLDIQKHKSVVNISLKGPDSYKALNEKSIQEITKAFYSITDDESIRIVVLSSTGTLFSTGPDLNWMKNIKDYSFEENYGDALNLSKMYKSIYECPKPTIAKIQGAAMGGGVGIVAVCDIALATFDTKFCFSESKLGFTLEIISPYVIEKIGLSNTRELFLTGEYFDGSKAKEIGLINHVVKKANIDEAVEKKIEALLSTGPKTAEACKNLIRKFSNVMKSDFLVSYDEPESWALEAGP